MKILAGTSKGLVVFGKIENQWKIEKIHFQGQSVSMIFIDPLAKRWWIGLDHKHWGPKLHFTVNEGQVWQQSGTPVYNDDNGNGKPTNLKKIWTMALASHERPGEYWLGTEPGGLFYSSDFGENFSLNEPLWNHPSRVNENQWFGAGRDSPFMHSIVLHPKDENHLYIAVSSAGIFETKDKGLSWLPKNNGLVATYLPDPNVEIGHDPHQLHICKNHPDTMWQQNHCGIFITKNGGIKWQQVSKEGTIPHYGFPIVIDDDRPEQAWVIPAMSDEERVAANLELTVYHTDDSGLNWKSIGDGLPEKPVFDIVLRHGFVRHKNTFTFGTNNGNVYLSEDKGMHWHCINAHLAPIFNMAIVDS